MPLVGSQSIVIKEEKPLYKGTFSKVFNGQFDKKDVIIKEVRKDNYSSELGFLRELDHPNVVKYLFHDEDSNFIYIVLEKCDMTLKEHIENHKADLNHRGLLWEIVLGMVYVHNDKDIIHRDIKPSNILLIYRNKRWTVKISDFGISKELPEGRSDVTQSITGSRGYMAPECLHGKKAMKSSDIFSLGLIFVYVLSQGRHAFGNDESEAHQKICRSVEPPDLEIMLDEYQYDAATLVTRMISWNPEERPDIKTVQSHHLFWKDEKKLKFVQQISQFLKKDEDVYRVVRPILDEDEREIAPEWQKSIRNIQHPDIQTVLHDRVKLIDGTGICNLLCTISELYHNFSEIVTASHDSKATEKTAELYKILKQCFPKLWDRVHFAMGQYASDLKDFYEYDDLNHLICGAKSDNEPLPEPVTHDSSTTGSLFDLNDDSASGQAPSETTVVVRPEGSSDKSKDIPKSGNSTGLTEDLNKVSVKPKDDTPSKLVLYSYQNELAEQALKGHNSLIIAPTGSGKTVVLTEIIQQHFMKNPESRVVFVVAKVSLARQQYLFLKKHLKHLDLSVNFMVGKHVTSPIGLKLLDSQVTVLTHQVLINEMNRGERYISFDHISLLIFDECHHTTGDHPYRILMALLFEEKEWKPQDIKTQVIGVTASPGVGKASNRPQVEAKLIQLMASLNITMAPQTVERNLEELQHHKQELQKALLEVETETDFLQHVLQAMGKIEYEIWDKILKVEEIVRKPPESKANQEYSNWVHDVTLHANVHMMDSAKSGKVHLYAEALKVYYSLLQIKDLVPNAVDAISKKVKFDGEGEDAKWLKHIYDDICQRSTSVRLPMLQKLEELISEEFEANHDARCMIFVQRRLTAQYLQSYLCASDSIRHLNLNPLYLIGEKSTQDKDVSGMNDVTVRKQFDSGESKVLVCTSIGDEGLHFAACSLVIMYDFVTGEIGSIQRSGRARQRKSRAIIITTKNSKNVELEKENTMRAEASRVAVLDVKKRSPDDLLKLVREQQQLHKRERLNRKRVREQQTASAEPPEKFRIVCAFCKNDLTAAEKLRHYNNDALIVRDTEFFDHTEKRFIEQGKGSMWGDVDYHCIGKKCKEASEFGKKVAWGMVKNGRRYPTLSIKKIALRSTDGGDYRYPKKRSKLPFVIAKSIGDPEDNNDANIYEKTDKLGPTIKNASTMNENESCLEVLKTYQDDNDDY